ncbi:KptA family-domain-containing protein [Crucibulum laeve]|uniref:2'-phosphotransferase n=1 Tax=Crucibulum laeve TaxID=68775 RepID=A0A5C3M257_9AGAR|nr:KptA family-domain-containing protein [Crucibulum laeve]
MLRGCQLLSQGTWQHAQRAFGTQLAIKQKMVPPTSLFATELRKDKPPHAVQSDYQPTGPSMTQNSLPRIVQTQVESATSVCYQLRNASGELYYSPRRRVRPSPDKKTWKHPFDTRPSQVYRPEFTKFPKPTMWKYRGNADRGEKWFGIQAGWLLRVGAPRLKLHMRADGYVAVNDILRLADFEHLDLKAFKKFVEYDPPQRFQLSLEDETPDGSEKVLWVRAKRGHQLTGVDYATRRIHRSTQARMAVYRIESKQWNDIRRNGISIDETGLIVMSQSILVHKRDLGWESSVTHTFLYIYVDLELAMAEGIKFYRSRRDKILSQGNAKGIIPPKYFKKVLVAEVSKQKVA